MQDISIETDTTRPQTDSPSQENDELSEVTLVETERKNGKVAVDISNNISRSSHPLWPEIEKMSLEQLHYARQEVGEGWQLLEKDGDLIMYKRIKEIDGMVEDPLKASHTVKGVTAFEMCHYFFQPEYRLEWERKKAYTL